MQSRSWYEMEKAFERIFESADSKAAQRRVKQMERDSANHREVADEQSCADQEA